MVLLTQERFDSIENFYLMELDVVNESVRFDAVSGRKVKVKKKGGGMFWRAAPGKGGKGKKLKEVLKKHGGKIATGAFLAARVAGAVGAARVAAKRHKRRRTPSMVDDPPTVDTTVEHIDNKTQGTAGASPG